MQEVYRCSQTSYSEIIFSGSKKFVTSCQKFKKILKYLQKLEGGKKLWHFLKLTIGKSVKILMVRRAAQVIKILRAVAATKIQLAAQAIKILRAAVAINNF